MLRGETCRKRETKNEKRFPLKRIRKIVLRSLLALLLLGGIVLGVYYTEHPNIVRCFLVSASDFDKEGTDVYVSRETPIEVRNLLWHIIEKAQSRNIGFWGEWKNHPVIIYCHNEADFKRYGSGTPGVAYLNPTQCFIVIGPHGLRTDIMSHEMCHVELFQRIGWFASEFEKPAWFDEGLALMLDYRYAKREEKTRYFGFLIDWDRGLRNGSSYVELNDLKTLEGFSQGDLRSKIFAYLTAGKEVSRWLEIVGKDGLLHFTSQLNQGASFQKAYAEVEEDFKKISKSGN